MTDRYLWAMGFAVEKEVTGTLSIGSRTDDDDDAKTLGGDVETGTRATSFFLKVPFDIFYQNNKSQSRSRPCFYLPACRGQLDLDDPTSQ